MGVTVGVGLPVGVAVGDGLGVTVGDGLGVTVGDGVGVAVGDGLGAAPVAQKPNVAGVAAVTFAFQDSPPARGPPEPVTTLALQIDCTPLYPKGMFQVMGAVDVVLTRTSAQYPLPESDATVSAAVTPPEGAGVVGLGVAVALAVGVAVGLGVALVVGVAVGLAVALVVGVAVGVGLLVRVGLAVGVAVTVGVADAVRVRHSPNVVGLPLTTVGFQNSPRTIPAANEPFQIEATEPGLVMGTDQTTGVVAVVLTVASRQYPEPQSLATA